MNERFDEKLAERLRTVCFTGHRTLPTAEEGRRLMGAVDAMIAAAVSRGYRIFVSGGAIGFDTLAACRVIVAKKRLPDIRLHLVLPCRNQTEKWTRVDDLKMYKHLLAGADRVDYITDLYTSTCMHERNREMVDRSALCIAYMTRQRGGTAYTVNYAERSGIGIINLGTNSYSAAEFERFSSKAK